MVKIFHETKRIKPNQIVKLFSSPVTQTKSPDISKVTKVDLLESIAEPQQKAGKPWLGSDKVRGNCPCGRKEGGRTEGSKTNEDSSQDRA